MSYRFNDDDTLHSLKQQIQDNFISKNKDGNVVIDGDITAKDAYFNAESMHLGDFKISAPDRDEDEYYLKAVLSNELNKKSTWVSKATPALHVSTHYPTGTDPLLLNDDTLAAASDTLAPTQGNVKAYVDKDYAEIYYHSTGFDTDLAAQDVDYQILGFDTNGINRGATPDHTNDHITVATAGDYLISYSVSSRSGVSTAYELSVKRNNGVTHFPNSHTHRNTTVNNKLGVSAKTFLATLVANETIEMWVLRADGLAVAKTLTIEDINLIIVKVS